MMPRQRREAVDFVDGFRTLAVMMAYADGFGKDSSRPDSQAGFEAEVQRLQGKQ